MSNGTFAVPKVKSWTTEMLSNLTRSVHSAQSSPDNAPIITGTISLVVILVPDQDCGH